VEGKPLIIANGIRMPLAKKGCKPWVFVSFGPSQKKEPFRRWERKGIFLSWPDGLIFFFQ